MLSQCLGSAPDCPEPCTCSEEQHPSKNIFPGHALLYLLSSGIGNGVSVTLLPTAGYVPGPGGP